MIQSCQRLTWALLSLLLFLTACQGTNSAAEENSADNQTAVAAAPEEDQAELPPPPVVITVAGPGQPSFSLLAPEQVEATATRRAELAIPTATPVPAATASPLPTTTASPTPMPTFTPPALPQTSPSDHYWLRRPVPEGGAVWTNKAYPYASTRGGTLRPHHGVEFDVPRGTAVLAAASGTVVTASADNVDILGPEANFYGNVVVIQLDSSLGGLPVFNLYAHLDEILVSVGQQVQAQELIALSGATGVADGPHLHFEVRVGQNDYYSTRNPLLWLYPFPDRGVVTGRITYANGVPAREAPLTLRRIDAPSPYAATTTYAAGDVNPDASWNENFVFDDVYAGYYELTVGSGDDKVTTEFWVYPYRTSFVEVVLP